MRFLNSANANRASECLSWQVARPHKNTPEHPTLTVRPLTEGLLINDNIAPPGVWQQIKDIGYVADKRPG